LITVCMFQGPPDIAFLKPITKLRKVKYLPTTSVGPIYRLVSTSVSYPGFPKPETRFLPICRTRNPGFERSRNLGCLGLKMKTTKKNFKCLVATFKPNA